MYFYAKRLIAPYICLREPGGTIFALLILILAALAGGMVIKLLTMSVSRLTGLNICLPPLLGMLLVGIIMKNVPYNYGQFGRIECIGNHSVAFGDSLNDISDFTDKVSGFDVIINRSSLNSEKTVIDSHQPSINSDQVTVENQMIPEVRKKRKADHVEKTAQDSMESSCKAKYIGHELDPKISQTLRSICLTVILLRAGLELDPVALWKLAGMVFRATFVPCLIEAVAAAVLSNLILGFPWTVGFVLGFVLAGVSPAVIIPNIMSLSERGYGVSKGIPTLVIATCSADDVVATTPPLFYPSSILSLLYSIPPLFYLSYMPPLLYSIPPLFYLSYMPPSLYSIPPLCYASSMLSLLYSIPPLCYPSSILSLLYATPPLFYPSSILSLLYSIPPLCYPS